MLLLHSEKELLHSESVTAMMGTQNESMDGTGLLHRSPLATSFQCPAAANALATFYAACIATRYRQPLEVFWSPCVDLVLLVSPVCLSVSSSL